MRMYSKLKISAEDYPDEFQEAIGILADTYNPFVDELETILNGNIDFENLNQITFQIEITVDSTGKPISGGKATLSGKNQPLGLQVIKAQNLTSSNTYPTSQPFISYTPSGTGIIQFNNISGLQANNKYRLTIIAY